MRWAIIISTLIGIIITAYMKKVESKKTSGSLSNAIKALDGTSDEPQSLEESTKLLGDTLQGITGKRHDGTED